jgi:probable metal-binding protein
MSSIHGHEVLQMMLASGESWTVASLEAAIRRRFGEEARFHTCSAENLSAAELVAFLEKKANLLPERKVLLPQKIRFAGIKMAATRCRGAELILRVEGRQLFIDKVQTFAAFSGEGQFINHRFK